MNTPDAHNQNLRALRTLLGLDHNTSERVLDIKALVTPEPGDSASADIADLLCLVLRRTIAAVDPNLPAGDAALEIVVGNTLRRTVLPTVWITMHEGVIAIGTTRGDHSGFDCDRIFRLVASCYAAGVAIRVAAHSSINVPWSDPLLFRPTDFYAGRQALTGVDFGKAYLAGCGAVGNAFVFGLSMFDVHGQLHVVDPDHVEDGNLNRNILCDRSQLGMNKAYALAASGQPLMRTVRMIPGDYELQALPERNAGPWLSRLIAATDSRRSRRRLQEEMPRDYFDGSTTGIQEVVMHFNQAGSPLACASCIYHEDAQEKAHEAHIARVLHVSIEEVRELRISARSARVIAAHHPTLDPDHITGLAYDSLFRELCASGALSRSEETQILAPLAFVSVLVGALLSFEFLLRCRDGSPWMPFNYWRLSPWCSPVPALRRLLPRRTECEYCARPIVQRTLRRLWSSHEETAGSGPGDSDRPS